MSRIPRHQIEKHPFFNRPKNGFLDEMPECYIPEEAITIPIPPRTTPYSPMSPVSPVPANQPPLYIPPIVPSIPGGNPR